MTTVRDVITRDAADARDRSALVFAMLCFVIGVVVGACATA